jgi:hypothetical protein
MPAKAQITKGKLNKRDYLKLKSFGMSKETVNRVKTQLIKWEK